jgi:hypothetical protein
MFLIAFEERMFEFTSTIANDTVATTATLSSTSSSITSSTSKPSNLTHHVSTSHTGAIAGGVVGGAIVLALLAITVWFCAFRKRKERAVMPREVFDADPTGPIEKDGKIHKQELNEVPGPMAGNIGYSEMAVPEVSSSAKDNNFKSARMSPVAELA